jgi:hypothetical protein
MSTGGFCGALLNLWLTRVELDNVQLEVSVLDGMEKAWSLFDLIIFTSSITLLLIVSCFYIQET